MVLKQRKAAFVQVGMFLERHYSTKFNAGEENYHLALNALIDSAFIHNGWFTRSNVDFALQSWAKQLNDSDLSIFCQDVPDTTSPKTVAVICAGNIPMVGFHDVVCVLLSGHHLLLKLSADDNVLIPFFIKLLCHYEPAFEKRLFFTDNKLSNFDAVIATGSNNTSNYFQHYFSKYPNIIRKNRSSAAVITGSETEAELKALGTDIFTYFGLGCRNVSKLFVPADYNFSAFFEAIFPFKEVIDNKKYANNYEYNRAIYLMGSIPLLDNNFLLLKEDESLHSPVAVLHYQYYTSNDELNTLIAKQSESLQCLTGKNYIPFGNSQQPVISDFADGVNTLDFLVHL
ncbi:MAG: acyl-CoA reductase [Sediminibacterium sp.]|nr:acyl-CoA reductase [Sediminibacterium sp.]